MHRCAGVLCRRLHCSSWWAWLLAGSSHCIELPQQKVGQLRFVFIFLVWCLMSLGLLPSWDGAARLAEASMHFDLADLGSRWLLAKASVSWLRLQPVSACCSENRRVGN
ncbi:hypothetical protein Nepgr_014770 [Nepenthes gracilis]|uniref:Secreted protein n=1 Tax=Nepenthes gracilis TaxID=150966 RepID=A0AAD3XQG3_NEPGR|nr:hypothetical protein Nepgr_014770 [Nepenthes gracilis]